MQNKICFLVLVIMLLNFSGLMAQDPMGLYFMNTIPQTSHLNPAMQPRAHVYVAFPNVSQNLKSDVAFKTLFQTNNNKTLLPIEEGYDYKKLRLATGKSLDIQEVIDVGLIGFGFRIEDNYFFFDTKIKNNLNFGIPYDFISIADEGFPNGKTFDFSPLKVRAHSYIEAAIGYSRIINDNLTLGVKLKPLFGLASAYSNIKEFELHTSREYWEYTVDGSANVAGPVEIEIVKNEDGGMEIDFDFTEDSKELVEYATSFKNKGLAFDVGGDYKITSRWSASAALINLGSIGWKHSTTSIELNGNYKFEGLEITGLDEDFEKVLEKLSDDITNSLKDNTQHYGYTTILAPELYLGTEYELTPEFGVGFLSRSIFYKDNFRQDFNLSANFQPYSFMSANLNYSLRPRGGNGIGTALMFLIGPLQIYTMAEYLSPVYADLYFGDSEESIIMFPNMRNLSFKVGLNLIFKKHGYKDTPMLSGY